MATIAIEVHGTIRHGLWSPERGESRWAQNLAAVLASAGHEVVAFGPIDDANGTGGWGAMPTMSGVRLLDWSLSSGYEADYYIDTAWYSGKDEKAKHLPRARWVLRGYFGRGLGGVADETWPAHHRLIVPYAHNLGQWQDCKNGPGMFLPYVMPPLTWWAETLDFRISIGRKAGVIWGNKTPFAPWMPATLREWAELLLIWLEVHGDLPRMILCSIDLPRVPPGTMALPTAPFGHVLDFMRSAKVCLNLPAWGSFPMEAALEGCVPIGWRDDPFLEPAYIAAGCGHLLLDPARPDPLKLALVLGALLHDDGLREHLLTAMRVALMPYSPESALECWAKIVEACP